MTLEALFVKKYEELESKANELEKKAKEAQIETNLKQKLLDEVVEFIKKGEPKITGQNHLYLSFFLYDEEKEKAVNLFKKLGINIKEQEL